MNENNESKWLKLNDFESIWITSECKNFTLNWGCQRGEGIGSRGHVIFELFKLVVITTNKEELIKLYTVLENNNTGFHFFIFCRSLGTNDDWQQIALRHVQSTPPFARQWETKRVTFGKVTEWRILQTPRQSQVCIKHFYSKFPKGN